MVQLPNVVENLRPRFFAIALVFTLILSGAPRVDAVASSSPSLLKTWSYGSALADDLAVDPSGNITIAGMTQNVTDVGNTLLLRFSASGSLLLQGLWGGPNYEEATGVTVDALGNVYLTGRTSSFGNGHFQIFLVKFSPSGNLLWQETWAGSDTAESGGAAIDSGRDVLISGATFNLTTQGGALLNFNSSGTLRWQSIWTGGGGAFGRIVTDASGGIYTASSTSILKFNSTGGLIWAKTWSGMTGGKYAADVSLDADGNIYLVGIGPTAAAPDSIYLLKLSKDGSLLWQRRWQISGFSAISGLGMAYEGVSANATGVAYATAVMTTCVANPRGCTPYYEPVFLEFNSTGSLLGELAIQGGMWSLGRPSTDMQGNIYITGAGGVAGVSFCSPAGSLISSSVSLSNASGQVLIPTSSVMPVSGTVSTPVGNETSRGGVVLMKFDSPISGGTVACSGVPVFPLAPLMIASMVAIVTVQARRRFKRTLDAKTRDQSRSDSGRSMVVSRLK